MIDHMHNNSVKSLIKREEVSYFGLIQGASCRIVYPDRVAEADVAYAAVIPDWGFGEGIILFSPSLVQLCAYLDRQPTDVAVQVYDLSTGNHVRRASESDPIGGPDSDNHIA
jgi:hypothetical protein